MKVNVIGNGSFGKKRIAALKEIGAQLVDYNKAEAVIVCVPPVYHKRYVVKALNEGKHVLCEKPMATTIEDAQEMIKAAKKSFLKIGSNHRYFGNVIKGYHAPIGELLTFDGRIGHDGKRIKNTWYQNKEVSGGGTLIDNGWHLIDLARWFMGDFDKARGILSGDPEHTALVSLTAPGRIATIISSWKNPGEYMRIKLRGVKGDFIIEDDKKRDSLQLELKDFFKCIKENKQPKPSGEDGLAVLKIIRAIYDQKN